MLKKEVEELTRRISALQKVENEAWNDALNEAIKIINNYKEEEKKLTDTEIFLIEYFQNKGWLVSISQRLTEKTKLKLKKIKLV